MVPDNFEQHTAGKAAMGDAAQWLKDGTVCIVTLWNGQPLRSRRRPRRAQDRRDRPGRARRHRHGRPKPAKLETGAVVRVPLFLNEGEVIRVDTRTGEYISRAK